MAEKIRMDAEKILKKKFKAKSGGYDALEVDEYLDLVREEYLVLMAKETELNHLLTKADKLTARNVDLEALNLQLTRKVAELERLVAKGGTTMENLRKIDKYERQLWALGVDPGKVK
jgi:DivIVA domain-containing protein